MHVYAYRVNMYSVVHYPSFANDEVNVVDGGKVGGVLTEEDMKCRRGRQEEVCDERPCLLQTFQDLRNGSLRLGAGGMYQACQLYVGRTDWDRVRKSLVECYILAPGSESSRR